MKISFTKNLKTINILDVTFDLCTGRYQPYKKSNDTPTYINVNSNRPPSITKALSDSIWKRISNISFDKATINNVAPFYNDVLYASGYQVNLTYQQHLPPLKKSKIEKYNMVKPTMQRESGNNYRKNISKTYWQALSKNQQVP